MYYLPLSIDAYESARQHNTLGRNHLKFVVNNIRDAISYKGDDNELTNWAKSNTLNMLHLVRFVNYCTINYSFIDGEEVSDGVIEILGANRTGRDYSEYVVDGKIAINILGDKIVFDTDKPNASRDPFPITQPIPVSSDHLRDNMVWYGKMYYYLMLKK
jgi:hypothetical protein